MLKQSGTSCAAVKQFLDKFDKVREFVLVAIIFLKYFFTSVVEP
jgi:hypothetical protein